jgi:hypothetical protein
VRHRLEERLEQLKAELAKGAEMQKQLAVLREGEQELIVRMQRISGAIQVLEEEIRRVEENGNV